VGRHISINLQLKDLRPTSSLVATLRRHDFYTPVALGGIQTSAHGDHWLLTGYALEDFVRRFMQRGAPAPASVAMEPAAQSEHRAYLSRVADAVARGTELAALSPFEVEDPLQSMTSLQPIELGDEAWVLLDRWVRHFPTGVVYLYGRLRLAARATAGPPWERAFRFWSTPQDGMPPLSVPFLFIRMALSPFSPATTELMVFSESTIWLRDRGSQPDLSGPVDADENLSRLAALTSAIAHAHRRNLAAVSLSTESIVSKLDLDRLARAFDGVLRLVPS
jgi:hypothetical protein